MKSKQKHDRYEMHKYWGKKPAEQKMKADFKKIDGYFKNNNFEMIDNEKHGIRYLKLRRHEIYLNSSKRSFKDWNDLAKKHGWLKND